MKFIKEIGYRQKGHMGQYEDWYDLFQSEDGSFHVRHKWDHVTVGTGKTDSGENFAPATQLDIDAALSDPEAKARIQTVAN